MQTLQQANPRFSSHPHTGCPIISHLAFADDILGSKRSLQTHRSFLSKYEACSGQMINNSKRVLLFFFLNCLPTDYILHTIAAVLGFYQSQLPVQYLGFPLYSGRKKKGLTSSLKTSFKGSLLTGWGIFLLPLNHSEKFNKPCFAFHCDLYFCCSGST